jgi:uncharacterized protein (DUF58 family)
MLAADHAFLLDRLTLGAGASAVLPTAAGVRRARTRGAGIEFHEYRPYQPGDDPRGIDWTVEARLRQLVVRVARGEGHVRLHILLDASASMSIGSPAKLTCAAQIAAALCYVAVERRDAAGVSTFGEGITTYMPPAEGRAQLFRAFATLSEIVPRGPSAIDRALEQYAAAVRGPGLVAVLSDYFEPGAGTQGLQSLLHRGLTPVVLQVVAREELLPELDEDTELVDIEHGHASSVVVDRGVLAAYHTQLSRHEATLKTFCAAHGCLWARIRSDIPFRELLTVLQGIGLLGVRT